MGEAQEKSSAIRALLPGCLLVVLSTSEEEEEESWDREKEDETALVSR